MTFPGGHFDRVLWYGRESVPHHIEPLALPSFATLLGSGSVHKKKIPNMQYTCFSCIFGLDWITS